MLAMGSSFWHGSHSYVGYLFDNKMIDLIINLMYSEAVQNMESDDPWLKNLSATPRTMNAFDLTEKLTRDLKDKPIKDWAKLLEEADIPKGDKYGLAACIGLIAVVLLPHWIAKPFMFIVITNGFSDFYHVLHNKILPA